MMAREEKIAIIESYIHGLGNGNFEKVPFAEDVILVYDFSSKIILQVYTTSDFYFW